VFSAVCDLAWIRAPASLKKKYACGCLSSKTTWISSNTPSCSTLWNFRWYRPGASIECSLGHVPLRDAPRPAAGRQLGMVSA